MLAGCAAARNAKVTVYQPLSGLQRPVIVDVTQPNLEGLAVGLSCPRGPYLRASETNSLCSKVETLFLNQGAEVTRLDGLAEEEALSAPPDLRVELRSRELYTNNPSLSYVISVMTLTLLPAIEDTAFALDVTVADDQGFVLARDSLQGRVLVRHGVGPWAMNALADELWRAPRERLSEDRAGEDISEDLYGQLSQIAFNAKVQRDVLRARAERGR